MNILLRKARSAVIRAKRLVVSQRFGFNPATIYANDFYEDGGFSKTEHSAALVADWVMQNLHPASVVDFGSGAGYYLRAFASRGVPVLGFEASHAGVAASGDGVVAVTYDLRQPVRLSRRFDVALCIEVAEHIPKRCSETLVESICSSAERYVVFTAAPPGTPGTDHINCQPEEFWFALFRAKGFMPRTDLTANLREIAERGDAAKWWMSWSWCFERQPAPASRVGSAPTHAVGGS